MKMKLVGGMLFVAALGGCGVQPEGTEGSEDQSVAETTAPLLGGTQSWLRQAIGVIPGTCTATLIDPSYVVTAAHCFSGQSGPQNVTFQTFTNTGALGVNSTINYGFAAGTNTTIPGPEDFAIGRLATPITTVSKASFGLIPPTAGSTVTAWGFGCTERVMKTGGGSKQYRTYTFPNSSMNCQGDSGGPRTYGSATANGNIWGINSGFYGDGTDAISDTTYYGYNVLDPVRTFGVPTQIQQDQADFTSWASMSGVKAVKGDFDGDGFPDIALTGGASWGTIPVAFGDSGGGYSVTNMEVSQFPIWARSARSVVAGDFDGDGDTDIALVGNSSWSTIPVAFSNRDGTFTVTNLGTSDIPGLGAASGAYALAGDFDGDGDSDIALLGGAGWTTIPTAFSSRNGRFTFRNQVVTNFPAWSRKSGARGLVGDFDGDGDADLALTGPSSWGTIPTAFSNRDGTFAVTNTEVFGFPALGTSEAKYVSGDFDGDGKADIAVLSLLNDLSNIHFAMSRGDGSYKFWILPIPTVPALSQRSLFILSGQLRFSTHNSLMLLGGASFITTVYL
jgi:hypothetical protein